MQLVRKQSEENKNTPLDLFPIQGERVARVENKNIHNTQTNLNKQKLGEP